MLPAIWATSTLLVSWNTDKPEFERVCIYTVFGDPVLVCWCVSTWYVWLMIVYFSHQSQTQATFSVLLSEGIMLQDIIVYVIVAFRLAAYNRVAGLAPMDTCIHCTPLY